VKAEADILLKDGKIKRPDRVIYNDEKTVVIDYKFGAIKEPKHTVTDQAVYELSIRNGIQTYGRVSLVC